MIQPVSNKHNSGEQRDKYTFEKRFNLGDA